METAKPAHLEQLAALAKQIPYGKCASYGAVGKAMLNPVSGLTIGRWLSIMGGDSGLVPWWRVVKADGEIAIFRRDVRLGMEQVARLEAEGITVLNERVCMDVVGWDSFSPLE